VEGNSQTQDNIAAVDMAELFLNALTAFGLAPFKLLESASNVDRLVMVGGSFIPVRFFVMALVQPRTLH